MPSINPELLDEAINWAIAENIPGAFIDGDADAAVTAHIAIDGPGVNPDGFLDGARGLAFLAGFQLALDLAAAVLPDAFDVRPDDVCSAFEKARECLVEAAKENTDKYRAHARAIDRKYKRLRVAS